MSLETSWFRGNTPRGLQIGEPYPSTQVNYSITYYCELLLFLHKESFFAIWTLIRTLITEKHLFLVQSF